MRTQIFSKVVWQEPAKKFEIVADDYNVEIVCSVRGEDKKFKQEASMIIDKENFSTLARGCFRRASQTMTRSSYKMNELTENKIICDYDYVNKDLVALRVTSYIKVGEARPTRYTKVSMYKFDNWDELKSARQIGKGGLLQFPSNKCLWEMTIPSFSAVHNAWYSQDIQFMDDCDDKFMDLFHKHGSYAKFLEVIRQNSSDEDEHINESETSSSSSTNTSSDVEDDDAFPF